MKDGFKALISNFVKLYQYACYLEATGILCLLPIFSLNQRVQDRNPLELMVHDHGLKNLVSLPTDLGRNLESLHTRTPLDMCTTSTRPALSKAKPK